MDFYSPCPLFPVGDTLKSTTLSNSDGNSNKFPLEDDQLQTDNNQSLHPGTAPTQDQNDSYDESLSEDDGDDDELYGKLQADYLTNPVHG